MKSDREFRHALGARVVCKITGFTGVVIGRTEWLYGCCGYTVKPTALDKDGMPQDSRTFDEDSIETLPIPPALEPVKSTTGGPVATPARVQR